MNPSPGGSQYSGYQQLPPPPPHRSPVNGRMPEPWHYPDAPRAGYAHSEPWNSDPRDHRARSLHHPTPTPPPMNGMDGYPGSSPQAMHPRGHRKSLSRDFLPPPLPPTMGRAESADPAAMRYEPVNGSRAGYQPNGHSKMSPPLPPQTLPGRGPREWEHKRRRSDESDGYAFHGLPPPHQGDRSEWGPYGPPPPGYQGHDPRVWHHYQQQLQQQQHHQQVLAHEEEMARRRHHDAEMMRPPAQKKGAGANRRLKENDEPAKVKKASSKPPPSPRRSDLQPQPPSPGVSAAGASSLVLPNGHGEEMVFQNAQVADARAFKEEPRRVPAQHRHEVDHRRHNSHGSQGNERQQERGEMELETRADRKAPIPVDSVAAPTKAAAPSSKSLQQQPSSSSSSSSRVQTAAAPARLPPPSVAADYPPTVTLDDDRRHGGAEPEMIAETAGPMPAEAQGAVVESPPQQQFVLSDPVWQWLDEYIYSDEGGDRPPLKSAGSYIYDGAKHPLLPADVLAESIGACAEVSISGKLLGPFREHRDALAKRGWTRGWRSRHSDLDEPCLEPPMDAATVLRTSGTFWEQRSLAERKIWGSIVYTDDSDVLAMCIHSGWIEGPTQLPDNLVESAEVADQTYQHPPDLLVTLRIAPQLQAYRGSYSGGLYSRSWLGRHDGLSLVVEKVLLKPAGYARPKAPSGARGLKARVERSNTLKQRLETLSLLDEAAAAKASLSEDSEMSFLDGRKNRVFPLSEARVRASAINGGTEIVAKDSSEKKSDWWRLDHL